jgi:hypothetical protein
LQEVTLMDNSCFIDFISLARNDQAEIIMHFCKLYNVPNKAKRTQTDFYSWIKEKKLMDEFKALIEQY